MALLDDEQDDSKGTQAQQQTGVRYPVIRSQYSEFLPNVEIRGIEVRENVFSDFQLVIDGRVVAESTHPGPVWEEYRKRVITPEDKTFWAHSLGVTFENFPIRREGEGTVNGQYSPEVQEEIKEYRGRFFGEYTLTGK